MQSVFFSINKIARRVMTCARHESSKMTQAKIEKYTTAETAFDQAKRVRMVAELEKLTL